MAAIRAAFHLWHDKGFNYNCPQIPAVLAAERPGELLLMVLVYGELYLLPQLTPEYDVIYTWKKLLTIHGNGYDTLWKWAACYVRSSRGNAWRSLLSCGISLTSGQLITELFADWHCVVSFQWHLKLTTLLYLVYHKIRTHDPK